MPPGSESTASTDLQPHKRSRGVALFAAALAIAVLSAGIGGMARARTAFAAVRQEHRLGTNQGQQS